MKGKKLNVTIEFCMLFTLPNLSLNWQFLFFEPDLQKKPKNRKTEYHLVFGIFKLAQNKWAWSKSFNFWTKLCQKRYFWSKMKKSCFCIHTWWILTILNFFLWKAADTVAFYRLFSFYIVSIGVSTHLKKQALFPFFYQAFYWIANCSSFLDNPSHIYMWTKVGFFSDLL